MAKFVTLKRLKNSVRKSRLVFSERPNLLLSTKSSCRELGPRSALRGRLPNVPGWGVVNAAGLMRLRSLLRYGFTPGIRSGRRVARLEPPPGVLITAVRPAAAEAHTTPPAPR